MKLLTPRNITLGFYAAGGVNVFGILLFSLGYTNDLMSALYPSVFSKFSLVCIQLWGLAYWSAAKSYDKVPLLIAVFAIEKFAYVATWLVWISHFGKDLPELMSQSFITGNFYAAYGLIDLSFGLFFAAVAYQSFKAR
jgi:hypothetical protein